MTMNNDNVEPALDLGLALAYNCRCIRTRLNSDSGAGVNAGLRFDMAYLASDPLAELVWSPQKGLSLKCAERPFLLWDVEPSNKVQGVTSSRDHNNVNPVGGINLVTSPAVLQEGETAEKASKVGSPRSSAGTMHSGPVNQRTTDYCTPLGTNASRPDAAPSEPLPGELNKVVTANLCCRTGDVTGGKREVAFPSNTPIMQQCEAVDSPVPNSISPGRRDDELATSMENKSKTKMNTHVRNAVSPLVKLESSAENDLPLLSSRAVCGQSDDGPQKDKSAPLGASPVNSRIHICQRKGKEKADLSDGNVNERKSEEKGGSHESVESCNSTGLSSTGKKRRNFENQSMVGVKRLKNQIQKGPASTSLSGRDSTFMNWILNMVRGFTMSSHDDAPSLALTLAHPDRGDATHATEIVTSNKSHDPESRKMGFQTIFQSLYCPNTELEEGRPLNSHNAGDGLSEDIADACRIRTNLMENITSCNLGLGQEKDEVRVSNSDLSKSKISLNPPSQERAIYSSNNDPEESLWIARFSQKPHGPLLTLGHCNRKRKTPELTTDCTKLLPSSQNCVEISTKKESSELKEFSPEDLLRNMEKGLLSATNFKAFFGLKRLSDQNDCKSICNSVRSPPSPKIKNSEVPASLFARKMDALTQLPLNVKDHATSSTTTCFFCGGGDHDLRNCVEVTGTELEDLLKNMKSFDGFRESSCFCIRCFQLNHWAISCPMVSSIRKQQSESAAALFNRFNTCKLKLTSGKERCVGMVNLNQRHNQDGDENTRHNPKSGGMMTDDRRSQDMRQIASVSGEGELKGNHISHLCNFPDKKIADVPGGMFDAIRRLRLSRSDMLRWMKSHISVSLLSGFFLRLRLGKWEEGLGGTGYHVASITGVQRENSSQCSKHFISVNVGGIKCLVETKYVSNHDFLEDELMAWWSSTSKSGGKLPSEENLKLMFEERKRLGF